MKSVFFAAFALASATAASAQSHWTVNGTFSDGATLSGFFDFNVYGYLSAWSLHTSAAGAFAAADYTSPPVALSPGSGNFGAGSYAEFYSNGYGDQHLELLTSAPLSGGVSTLLPSSFEAIGYDPAVGAPPGAGPVRTLMPNSVLATPEPASWIMLIMGFGLTGTALRRRQPSRPEVSRKGRGRTPAE